MKRRIPPPPPKRRVSDYFLMLLLLLCVGLFFYTRHGEKIPILTEAELKEMIVKGKVERVALIKNKHFVRITCKAKKGKKKAGHFSNWFQKDEEEVYIMKIVSSEVFDSHWITMQGTITPAQQMAYEIEEEVSLFEMLMTLLMFLLQFAPILLVIYFSREIFKKLQDGLSSGNPFSSIGKSKAVLWDQKNKNKVTFKDVAGLKEAKLEVQEIVKMLKHPLRYKKLGGRPPKGVLLVGPPGTGKTLLAKAVAGEANVPFYSASGSDFVEMFVGVGSSRVRDLFKKAQKNAPCIIFIDEIDALGGARNRSMGHSEGDNTLKALLTEMDGFQGNNVIVFAATNNPESLDSALLRPGRFDRQVEVAPPSLLEREDIFIYHAKKIKINPKISLHKLAEHTPGFTGADIANICNEAALIASRNNAKQVNMNHLQEAIDRQIGGIERKSRILLPKERETVAYHEAGHALASILLPHAQPLLKVTIIPRGLATLGYAQYLPNEQYLRNKEELEDDICTLLGGRVAEELLRDSISTGASNDLERVTSIVYDYITRYGMNEKIGSLSFAKEAQQAQYYGRWRPYSEDTAQRIDVEARAMVKDLQKRTHQLLSTHIDLLKAIGDALLTKEILYSSDLQEIMGDKFPPEKVKKPLLNKASVVRDEKPLKKNATEEKHSPRPS
jgi:AFG3 family protein